MAETDFGRLCGAGSGFWDCVLGGGLDFEECEVFCALL